jgi:hypothetical protein
VSGNWLIISILLLFVSAFAAGIAMSKTSVGVAVFTFGFVLLIVADEIALTGNNPRRREK